MPTSASVKPTVVLTVDDHPLIRSALREVVALMTERIELIEASDPEEGLEQLRRRPDTDLVFLDLNFSQHDGLAYIERFRSTAPAVPLVVYLIGASLCMLAGYMASISEEYRYPGIFRLFR